MGTSSIPYTTKNRQSYVNVIFELTDKFYENNFHRIVYFQRTSNTTLVLKKAENAQRECRWEFVEVSVVQCPKLNTTFL